MLMLAAISILWAAFIRLFEGRMITDAEVTVKNDAGKARVD